MYPYKLNYFKNNDALRKDYAKRGKEKYFRYFNSTIVSDYIISKSFGVKTKKKIRMDVISWINLLN